MSLDHPDDNDDGKIITHSNYPLTNVASSSSSTSDAKDHIRNGQNEHEKPQNMFPGNHKHQGRQSQEETPGQGRIVNGEVAPIGKYKWFAAYDSPGCGGSLITAEFVLTAAHCVTGFYPGYVGDIRVGAYCGFFNPVGCSDPAYTEELTFGYDGVFKHPEYQSSAAYDHDFALIKLNDQSTISPVQIDQGSFSPSYTEGTFTLMDIEIYEYFQYHILPIDILLQPPLSNCIITSTFNL